MIKLDQNSFFKTNITKLRGHYFVSFVMWCAKKKSFCKVISQLDLCKILTILARY